MGLYLYCLGAADHPEPGPATGIGGVAVERREVAGFVAWVSDLPTAPGASLDRIREHNAVVERVCADRTVLPLRFGQWFPEDAELAASLAARRDELAAMLARVDGAMEMGVRVVDPAHRGDAPDRSTGRAYLEALARRARDAEGARERADALAAELRAWIGSHVRDQRERPLGSAAGLLTVAHLVARHDIGSYQARLREFPGRHPDLRFLFSGPWPPYGFVEDERPRRA